MSAPTAAPAAAPAPTGRDPVVVIWVVAGACWLLTTALVLAGGLGSCHDGVALGGMTWWPARLTATFAAWLVMVGAMMLPTVVPLMRLLVPVTAGVPRPGAARAAFLGGYLAVWSGFAAAAMVADHGVGALVGDPVRSAARHDLVLGATLVVAGLFQFSPVKDACLTVCRSPWRFLWQYYGRGARGGVALGVRHGVFCLGCCGALMLVMLGTGVGSLLWMSALTGVMVVEKTAPWGARLVAPLGAALVLVGVAVSLRAAQAMT
jgi:predicted metal-binding membrane protein